jgi:hypothetical protein
VHFKYCQRRRFCIMIGYWTPPTFLKYNAVSKLSGRYSENKPWNLQDAAGHHATLQHVLLRGKSEWVIAGR